MNLKRQLLLVSLLTLMLPWAGCEFIRETEEALRGGQQQMLAGAARAHANNMAQYRAEFPMPGAEFSPGDQLYVHELDGQPTIDGYFDDWPLARESLRPVRGADGPIRFAVGAFGESLYLYVEVSDRNVIYASPSGVVPDDRARHSDRVHFINYGPPYPPETIVFAAEAPGPILSNRPNDPDLAISAFWQDVPGGYQLEARIPAASLGTNLGVTVINTDEAASAGTRSDSFATSFPGPTVRLSSNLQAIATGLAGESTRLIVTDAAGWRIAVVGEPDSPSPAGTGGGFARFVYDLIVESGEDPAFAEPAPLGRERETYISSALAGIEKEAWYRSTDSGRAIVAVAAPIRVGGDTIGTVVLQQGTSAILSLTNEGLSRLINVTLITTLVVAAILLGYATWLSRRIRRLAVAAEAAVENDTLQAALPSALAADEIGDLSRGFSSVLRQLGDYNEYLRSLASKLSHELRTPLAIVTSSLENLDHERLSKAGAGYTARAREGADRLRNILSAMSEASRVEELMANVEPENFDLGAVLESTVSAYRDVYKERQFRFECESEAATMAGSPELVIQMLDKLVDNAVDFSDTKDTISIQLSADNGTHSIAVANPGPPLPEKMRTQLFDSMVSVRQGKDSKHLGLGLYVARLIAAGHGGRIEAENIDGGVVFRVTLPASGL